MYATSCLLCQSPWTEGPENAPRSPGAEASVCDFSPGFICLGRTLILSHCFPEVNAIDRRLLCQMLRVKGGRGPALTSRLRVNVRGLWGAVTEGLYPGSPSQSVHPPLSPLGSPWQPWTNGTERVTPHFVVGLCKPLYTPLPSPCPKGPRSPVCICIPFVGLPAEFAQLLVLYVSELRCF